MATVSFPDHYRSVWTLEEVVNTRFHIYGPRGSTRTATACEILGVSCEYPPPGQRGEHHYLDLKKAWSSGATNISFDGASYTLTLNPIPADMAPGTYSASMWVTTQSYRDQDFAVADFQIGTETVEPEIVEGCPDCHLGAASGKIYLHHIDPSGTSKGNWSLDKLPVEGCRSCHNTRGYSRNPIVRKVHGVHMGKLLKNPANTDPVTGAFRNYSDVVFPADVRDCTKCHLDDAWKEKPSRLACGACHDTVDFATGENHAGGPQADDRNCSLCHPPAAPGLAPIREAHQIPPPAFTHEVQLSLTPPANGKYYLAGEAPVVRIALKDAATGAVIDPATIRSATFSRANLYVSGPRSNTVPVLTTAATGTAGIRAAVTNGVNAPWNLSSAADFQLKIDAASIIAIAVAGGSFADSAVATSAEVATWLNSDPAFRAVATALSVVNRTAGTDRVVIKSNTRGTTSSVEILDSDVTPAMGWPRGSFVPVEARYYANNDFRVQADPFDEDPRITRVTGPDGYVSYQLDDVAGLGAGTYTAFVETRPLSGLGGWAYLNFQVGAEKPDPYVATNCRTCHEDTRMHGAFFAVRFEPDICKNCHDYEHQIEGKIGWAAANNGFGAGPFKRRIHGVHFGHYLDKPEEVHQTVDYSGVIFPQDVRNCTKCHSETTSWAEKPSRLACLACHDGDAALAHGRLMTFDPTPADQWSGDEEESCSVCHDASSNFAPDIVHNIWIPYVPPYLREGE